MTAKALVGRRALAIETLVAGVVLAGCGGGSSKPPPPPPQDQRGTAVPVSVVITDDKLTANVSELPGLKGAVVQIRNASAKAAELQVKANGQVIGTSRPPAGGGTSLVITKLLPGRLRLQAGGRSTTIKVVSPNAAPTAAPTEEGGDEDGNTVGLRVTVTPRGIVLGRKTVPAFLKLSIDLRSQLPKATSVTFKAKGISAVYELPLGGSALVPLDGLKPGLLRVRAGDAKATVTVKR